MYDEGIIARYVDHMKVRNLRHWTIYCRQRALVRLGEWADGLPILYLTEPQLKDWQAVRAKTICAESLRADTSHIRQFYKWAVTERYRVDDPTSRLIMPRVMRRLPRPIADKLLAGAMNDADVWVQAMLGLAAMAGLRACEIAQLDWADVDMAAAEPQIRIEDGKGGKSRRVPISHALIGVLEQLPTRRGMVIPRLDGAGGQNRASIISKRANQYLHGRGIAETLHQCRHRFATVTYRECRDIRAVQELLGHASPTTTAIYAAASPIVAIRAVEAAGTIAAA